MGSGYEKTFSFAGSFTGSAGNYEVSLERNADTEEIGLTIVGSPEQTFAIEAVKDHGMVPCYNKAQEGTPQNKMQVGDVIVAVNGVFGDLHAMKKQFSERSVMLSVRRFCQEGSLDRNPFINNATAEESTERELWWSPDPHAAVASWTTTTVDFPECAPFADVVAMPWEDKNIYAMYAAGAGAEIPWARAEVAPAVALLTSNDESWVDMGEEPLEKKPESGVCEVCGFGLGC